MLDKLTIKNVALIERAEVEFGAGLNVLSGETGSGKSVILDSINFVLGAKADKSMIRHGENECSVSAVFRCGEQVQAILRDMDLDADEEIIISRKYRQDGRGDIRVNGNAVNAAMLRKITSHLVDVHGQSEHFYLLSEINQLKVIDRAAGVALQEQKEKLAALLLKRRELNEKRKALGGDEAERGRRIDILKYQLDEIGKADLKDGEDEALAAKKNFFANIEKIAHSLAEASEYLRGDNAAVDCLNGAKRALSDAAPFGEEYASLTERLESTALEAEDIGESLASLADDIFYDEREAEETENRLDLIRSLKKKYGGSIEEILQFAEKAGEEYDLLLHCDEEFARLAKESEKNDAAIFHICKSMTDIRKEAAEAFCARVTDELKTLNIRNAQFCAEFAPYTESDTLHAGGDGADRMQFLFSANKGEPLKPLSKVISGGEMSRLMLAIKTRMSDINDIDTYIFDEIDAGISGTTAKTVAEKFADISASKQILAVSHLAQIAAMADENFLISKAETPDGKTLTDIVKLDAAGKKDQLIRLLGGTVTSDAARALAEELILGCKKYRGK